ncbi:hypothetical protein PAXRUDRAFT_770484 [Paxillus rubicundulus Ve08.2h10]|uniref:WW domain-containing protein n=1 Tax=Paxillus rubicundulus Ve08.2h10 TaxID=930991 RepID=A0A0D0DFU0_9AGAM|nr:hypothetical protein PAXRUDRAFT_770484 [Paxillus rubicundulus Ve08.2h10]
MVSKAGTQTSPNLQRPADEGHQGSPNTDLLSVHSANDHMLQVPSPYRSSGSSSPNATLAASQNLGTAGLPLNHGNPHGLIKPSAAADSLASAWSDENTPRDSVTSFVSGASTRSHDLYPPVGKNKKTHILSSPLWEHPSRPTIGDHTPETASPMGATLMRVPTSVSDTASEEGEFALTFPSALKRYQRPHPKKHIEMPSRDPTVQDLLIEKLTLKYPSAESETSHGWSKHIHPEGTPYYYHGASKTYTEWDICEPDIKQHIEFHASFLWRVLAGSHPDAGQYELVLELDSKGADGVVCEYYFVNHAERCLFWLDNYERPGFLMECKGVISLSHKKFGVEAEYWLHWDRFPACGVVTKELVKQLKHSILYLTIGQLTETCPVGGFTVTSTVESTLEQLKNYTSLVNSIRVGDETHDDHSAVIIGRIMHYLSRSKYLNFHGEECVRLRDDQSVHGWRYEPSWFMAVLAPILFMAPMTNVRSLHKLYVDELVKLDRWTDFVNDFTSQLEDTNLLATVLLTTNVGFLATQSVDSYTNRSLRQVASYLSVICSIASIMLGLVFIERSRHDRSNSVNKVVEFLGRFHRGEHGLEVLALIFSLPYAYLMWGMVFFFIAFSAECYNVGNDIVRECLGVAVIVLGIPAALSIWASRKQRRYWWWQADKLQPMLGGGEGEGSPKESSSTWKFSPPGGSKVASCENIGMFVRGNGSMADLENPRVVPPSINHQENDW